MKEHQFTDLLSVCVCVCVCVVCVCLCVCVCVCSGGGWGWRRECIIKRASGKCWSMSAVVIVFARYVTGASAVRGAGARALWEGTTGCTEPTDLCGGYWTASF